MAFISCKDAQVQWTAEEAAESNPVGRLSR